MFSFRWISPWLFPIRTSFFIEISVEIGGGSSDPRVGKSPFWISPFSLAGAVENRGGRIRRTRAVPLRKRSSSDCVGPLGIKARCGFHTRSRLRKSNSHDRCRSFSSRIRCAYASTDSFSLLFEMCVQAKCDSDVRAKCVPRNSEIPQQRF